ncbi:MOSC domain-containing protein [Kribbella albertanoniae]|uniref:Molybdenum cofactor biosysynthesis protein n=1 Tax=Kribbella albertanoniae TaxID=1266829 RepID=A0A4R4P8K9_9ACTN|nr:molybdenum cofactor biosysynthesis protein [Kribbella albertanoniae]TDC18154.1 molybdenum cofactor biosysynthesis protein [Kribbella albertanoniae]
MSTAVEIVALVVSPVHAFEGRPQDGPRPDPVPIGRDEVEVRAGLGIVGDRYFAQKVHRNAAVTLLDADSVEGVDPAVLRRNIVVRGYPIDTLAARLGKAGRRFSLDSGAGPVEFQAYRPANPCAWMNVVVGPGAMKALRGRGGVRATPVTSGVLRVGPAVFELLD